MTEPGDSGQPCCLIIAGADGAGKATLFSYLDIAPGLVAVHEDPDAAVPSRPGSPMESGSPDAPADLSSARVDELVGESVPFAYLTTLSDGEALRLMERARASGYRVVLHYLFLRHPRLNMLRVRARRALGGRDIAQADIIRRYDRSLDLLEKAIPLMDEAFIYDNSGRHPDLKVHLAGNEIRHLDLDGRLDAHRRIREALEAAREARSRA